MKTEKLKKVLAELFENDVAVIERLLTKIEHEYKIWEKYDKPKK